MTVFLTTTSSSSSTTFFFINSEQTEQTDVEDRWRTFLQLITHKSVAHHSANAVVLACTLTPLYHFSYVTSVSFCGRCEESVVARSITRVHRWYTASQCEHTLRIYARKIFRMLVEFFQC